MGCCESKPKTKGPAITGYTKPGSVRVKNRTQSTSSSEGGAKPMTMGEGTSRPVNAADNDDVIMQLRNSRRKSTPDAARRFDEGLGVSNATVDYKHSMKKDADVLKAAQERDEGVADIVNRGHDAQSEVDRAKAAEEEARSGRARKSSDPEQHQQLIRKLSERSLKRETKGEKIRATEDALLAQAERSPAGYMDVETPAAINREEKAAAIARFEAAERERIAQLVKMQEKIGKAALDEKHTKTPPPKQEVTDMDLFDARQAQASRQWQEEQFASDMESRIAEAKRRREEAVAAEAARKEAEEQAAAAAKAEAEARAKAEAEEEARRKAEEEAAARKAAEEAKKAEMEEVLKRQQRMNAIADSATPWLAGSQQ